MEASLGFGGSSAASHWLDETERASFEQSPEQKRSLKQAGPGFDSPALSPPGTWQSPGQMRQQSTMLCRASGSF